jgi:hypothetical protein
MPSLREKMAEHGFESNDDYGFQLRCLLETPTRGIRTLNIVGDGERRKTAFANALARALEVPHVLYHDFTDESPPLPDVILPPSRDEFGREEPPIEPLDQIVSEACAQSEGEPTVLILDQLHAADFREHIRLHRLVSSRIWSLRDGHYFANPRHLLLFLISEEPLYHALQRESFRVWVNRLSEQHVRYEAGEFGLNTEVQPLLDALAELFRGLGSAPTPSELRRVLADLQLHIRTAEHLKLGLYGRVEGIKRESLADPMHEKRLRQVVDAAQRHLAAEQIEFSDIQRRDAHPD